jgi:hypothetical protein
MGSHLPFFPKPFCFTDPSLEPCSPLVPDSTTWDMLFPPAWQQRVSVPDWVQPSGTCDAAFWPGNNLGSDMDLFATKNALFDQPSLRLAARSRREPLQPCPTHHLLQPLTDLVQQVPAPSTSPTACGRPRRAASAGSAIVQEMMQQEMLDEPQPLAKRGKTLDDEYNVATEPVRARRRPTQSRKKTGSTRVPRLQSKEGARQRLKALCKLYLTHQGSHPSVNPDAFILCKPMLL